MKVYKTSIILSCVLMTLAFMVLGLSPYYLDSPEHKLLQSVCIPVLVAGLVSFFVTEILFNIFYMKSKEHNIQQLKTSVVFGGAGFCIIAFLFLIFNTIFCAIFWGDYKFPVCFFGVILFILYMILQKRRLAKSGVKVGKATSIASLSIVLLCVVFVIFIVCCFEFIVYNSPMKVIEIISETRLYAEPYNLDVAKTHILVYVFMIMSLPLFVSVLMNYIELLVKVRKLSVT